MVRLSPGTAGRSARASLLAGGSLIAAGCALIPFDRGLSEGVRALPIGGDVQRELVTLGQYGQLGSVVLVGVVIWLLDPDRRRRLLDWCAAAVPIWLVVNALKLGLGRVRPRLGDDGGRFLLPWGAYPLGGGEPVHAWDIAKAHGADLWSMPSSHTAFAVLLSVFLATLYPRLRRLVAVLAAVVGFSRVQTGAHYLSDVLVGAGVALLIAPSALRGCWGVRTLDRVWVRLIDRSATPAYPEVLRREARRGSG